MPELATVVLSVALSLISALIVAYANNRFQKVRDEIRVRGGTGKTVVYQLAMLDYYYINKYNFAYACRNSKGTQMLSDKFGLETEAFKTMNSHESEIYALTKIYFPCCDKELKEWRGALGRADAFYRMFAGGTHMEDSGVDPITSLLGSSNTLSSAIARKIEVAGSVSPYYDHNWAAVRLLRQVLQKVRRSKKPPEADPAPAQAGSEASFPPAHGGRGGHDTQ